MPIAFDTTGFRQHDPSTWFHPATGDQVSLTYFDLVPDLPAPLEDVAKLRHDLAVTTGEVGCLIEAHVVPLGGVPAVFQVVKVPLPNQPTGQAFIASLTVPRATCSAVLKLQAAERGMTGAREAVLMARLGFDRWVQPHPYAPQVQGRLPFHAGDDPRWDPEFPDHPLTRVRAWAHHIIRTAQLDPRFAALPPFQPTPPPTPPAPSAAPAPPAPPATPPGSGSPTVLMSASEAPTTRASEGPTRVISSRPAESPTVHIKDAPAGFAPSGPDAPPATPVPTADQGVTTVFSKPTPAVGATITTVVPGIPMAGYLPLWIDGECTFWRMTDPGEVLGRLAHGVLARTPLADNRFRDVVGLDRESGTLTLFSRFRADDGGDAAEIAQLEPVGGQEAHEALTAETLTEAFRWVGRVNAAAAERGEYVAVERAVNTDVLSEPYVLMVVQEFEGQRISVVQTAPVPGSEVPVWQGNPSMTSPASPETIEAGGLLALYAMDHWGVHPLHLALTFGPTPRLVRD
ncbi:MULTISPECIES: hypothetical protein [unclassified Saccharothrix]|uniref:hypothetical protein n=1 Tax=unclassified Saccharothrix TaxID=2593673 RepID=UPI00307F321C